jgi:glutathione peroxidase
MKRLSTKVLLSCLIGLSGLLGLSSAQAQSTPVGPACPPLLNHTLLRLQDEAPQSLCQYAGKVILAVNTASYCGFTPQYKGLEALHRKYQTRGLVVLGFPSNDFNQEKASNKDIADFCENTFGVQFPMFAASSVRGAQANALFRELIAGGAPAPKWNFYKYLIGRDGRLIDSYSSLTDPDSRSLTLSIEQALLAKP